MTTMTNQYNCKFECQDCGLSPTKDITDDEGRFVAYCETCENDQVYECLLVYKSRGAHECVGTYPTGVNKPVRHICTQERCSDLQHMAKHPYPYD